MTAKEKLIERFKEIYKGAYSVGDWKAAMEAAQRMYEIERIANQEGRVEPAVCPLWIKKEIIIKGIQISSAKEA